MFMTEKSYEDAVQRLKRRNGGRWEGHQDEGRDEMARILKGELGYSTSDANATLDALMRSGQIRYQRPASEADRGDTFAGHERDIPGDASAVPPAPVDAGSQTPSMASGGLIGTPIVPLATQGGAGYWEIGSGESDDLTGRRGQVTPR
jgi:hypothetical protein